MILEHKYIPLFLLRLGPVFLVTALSTISFSGCRGGDQNPELALARVDNRYLYQEELQLEDRFHRSSLGEVAEGWIDRQVLLRHANGSIIDETILQARLTRAADHIVSQLLLDSLIYRRFHPSNSDIRKYYEDHLEEFVFATDAVLVSHLVFLHLKDARDALVRLRSQGSRADSLLMSYNFDRQLVYRNRLIPSLEGAVFSLSAPGFRGPINSDFGFHLIRVENTFTPGDTIPLELVSSRIVDILFQLRLPINRAIVLDSLREEVEVEVFVE